MVPAERKRIPVVSRPLVPLDFVCDSLTATGPIELTTTWLVANLYKGCPLSCAYCFRLRWHPGEVPTPVVDVDDAVEQMLRHPSFVPHETPLTANISSTDAMLPGVRESTVRFAEQLDARGLRNPLGITTKLSVPERFVQRVAALRHLRPIVLISYADVPWHIEPVPVTARLRNFALLARNGIPSIHLYKPIVPGWNDSDASIRKVLLDASRQSTAIVTGGLRTSPEILDSLSRVGAAVDTDVWHPKHLPGDLEASITRIHAELSIPVPLYRHTSCAVSMILGTPNYNSLFDQPEANCVASCPADQVARCRP